MDKYSVQATRMGSYHILQARGGMVTVRERAALGYGEKSLVQNIRCWHPGYETRKGYSKLNTSAYNAAGSSPQNMYQFAKGKVDEKHLFVQFGNYNLVEATNAPPATGTTFGTVVDAGSSGQIPASFANINDYMIYSNGSDQHKIYPGSNQPLGAVVVVTDTGAHAHLPDLGIDYTQQASDGDPFTSVSIDEIGDYTNDFDAIYIMSKVPIDLLNVVLSEANDTAGVLELYYWGNSGWTSQAITDNTIDTGKTLAVDGTIVLNTTAANRGSEQERYMFGQCGFWYRLNIDDGNGTGEVEISSLLYSTTSFPDLVNVWNGVPTDIVEAFHYDASDTNYFNYAGDAITISEMATADYIYFSSPYELEGAYIDFGSTANTTTAVPTVQVWRNDAWATLTQKNDGTESMLGTGWITWARTSGDKKQFKDTQYHAYWYRITFDAAIDDNIVVGITGMPYFDIANLGPYGRVSAAWKNRALYTFNKFPRDIYVTEVGEHMKLNGSDYAILEPGDGRDNATLAIKNFYNEIMVFQEEKGEDGGCVTIFEGYSPSTFGKLVLSTKVGTLNSKTVAVVDGSKTSTTKTDLTSQTQAFFISHYGVFMSDGKVVTAISDDIQNYFDPRFTECIRKGYENEMWLEYDSTENVIKIGIVSGSSATTCNKFFVYDLTDGVWYEDVYADSISVFKNIEAGSGSVYAIQIAASSALGFVYHMNNGTNDDGTKITSKIQWEFNNGPFLMDIEEILTRVKVQADKAYSWTVEEQDLETDDGTKSMSAKVTNHTIRRNRHQLKAHNIAWITFALTMDTIDTSLYLYDAAVISKTKEFK